MEWILAHWAEIAGVAALFVLIFDRIAKLTPTMRDDEIVSTLYRIAAVLGLKVKDNPGGMKE